MTRVSRASQAAVVATAFLGLAIALIVIAQLPSGSQAGGPIQGDADCNQTVNPYDALAVVTDAAGAYTSASCVYFAGDTDCSGSLEGHDAIDILRYLALGPDGAPAAGGCPDIGAPMSQPTSTPSSSGPGPCAGPGGGPTLSQGAPGTPEEGVYFLQDYLPVEYLGDAAEKASEFAVIPGSPNQAVIAELDGYIRRVALDQSFPVKEWGDAHNLVESSGEEGLLSLAFSPDYENDCRVYLYYTPGSPLPSVLSRFRATPIGGLDLASEEILLEVEQPYIQHNGGHIVFGNDGYLYLGFGDGGDVGDPENRAQELTTLLGKMIRIDVSTTTGYDVPADNPFVGGFGGTPPEVYALGFRNPWRFSSDPVTGDIWIGDAGQSLWEEVDKLQAGGNYGWDCFEGTAQYDYTAGKCDAKSFVTPRATYDHSDGNEAVVGGVIYRGDDMPELYGWYVYGDYASGRIWALNPATTAAPVLLGQAGTLITSFTLGADGEIYVVTYNAGIFKLAR